MIHSERMIAIPNCSHVCFGFLCHIVLATRRPGRIVNVVSHTIICIGSNHDRWLVGRRSNSHATVNNHRLTVSSCLIFIPVGSGITQRLRLLLYIFWALVEDNLLLGCYHGCGPITIVGRVVWRFSRILQSAAHISLGQNSQTTYLVVTETNDPMVQYLESQYHVWHSLAQRARILCLILWLYCLLVVLYLAVVAHWTRWYQWVRKNYVVCDTLTL